MNAKNRFGILVGGGPAPGINSVIGAATIRSALDGAGMPDVPVMAYASKMSSAYYGPFRIAAESTPRSGDRRARVGLRDLIRRIGA